MDRVLALLGLVLFLTLIVDAPVEARRARLVGDITAVDLAATPPRVTVSDGAASETFSLTTSTRLLEESAPGTLADLRVGAGAEVHYDSRTLIAIAIEVTLAEDQTEQLGSVVAVDLVNRTVSLSTDDHPSPDLNLSFDALTDLRLGDTEITPAELPFLEGSLAVVEYFVDSHLASEIHFEAPQVRNTVATVVTIDTQDLRVTPRGGGELTLGLTSGTVVRLGTLPVSANTIQSGDQVRIEYAELMGGHLAFRVVIQAGRARSASGQLQAVAPDSLTLSTRSGSVQLSLTAATTLRLNGQPASLAQLEAAQQHGPVRLTARFISRGTANLAVSIRASARLPR